MSDNLTYVLLAAFIVFGPAFLLYKLLDRIFGARRLSKADTAGLQQIAQIADRMDRRMEAIERILDVEIPAWRRPAGPAAAAPDDFYRRAG